MRPPIKTLILIYSLAALCFQCRQLAKDPEQGEVVESRSLREFMVSQHQYFIDVETDIVETLGDVPQQRINFIVQGLIDEGDINSPYVVIHEPGNAPKLEPTTYELYKEFIEETGLNFPDTTTIHLDVGDERINLDSLFNTSP